MRTTRRLFGSDGTMTRHQAYQMIDEAPKGTVFFRIVISPDPRQEDTEKDLHLGEITEITLSHLQDRLRKGVPYAYVLHDDQAPNRHIHVIAAVPGRLNVKDFQALRETATQSALLQRQELDQARHHQQREQEEGLEWSR